jgi:hypothetical protein
MHWCGRGVGAFARVIESFAGPERPSRCKAEPKPRRPAPPPPPSLGYPPCLEVACFTTSAHSSSGSASRPWS